MSKRIPYEVIMNRIKSDVDSLAEEVYKKGYDEGERRATTHAELEAHDIENIAKENYQKGLEDAWECARKIIGFVSDGGMSYAKLSSIFGTISYPAIMRDFSVSESMEKIRAYEEAENEIRVGDEVEDHIGTKAITLDVSINNVWTVFTENACVEEWNTDSFSKTGRHFDEIGTLLEKLREEE